MVDIRKDDVFKLAKLLPINLQDELKEHDLTKLIEIVVDLGRIPEARFSKKKTILLGDKSVQKTDIQNILGQLDGFNFNNRVGIEGTLHRISCVKNKNDEIIGLTMRVGRSITGTIEIIKDCLEDYKSVLLLGPPGVGKTTMLREIANYLSTEKEQRVVIIDTSNEIAGDGDIPHPAIGRARRMQLPSAKKQHDVMIEAVENHTPEVIVIDEIGCREESEAARTIAERGVSLVGTAHGSDLMSVVQNPSINDLIGGIQSVTLGDEEAKKRGTRKSILERASKPTFDICVEIIDRFTVNIHMNVAKSVDQILDNKQPDTELRSRDKETDKVTILEKKGEEKSPIQLEEMEGLFFTKDGKSLGIYPYAISKSLLKRAFASNELDFRVVNTLDEADFIFALSSYCGPEAKILKISEAKGIPVKIVGENTLSNISEGLEEVINDLPYLEQNWQRLQATKVEA